MATIKLQILENDDLELLEVVSQMITRMAKMNAYDHFAVVRIENRFDDKWAGFQGVFRDYHHKFGEGVYDVIPKEKVLPPFARPRVAAVDMFGEPQEHLAAVFYFSTKNAENGRASLLGSIPLNHDRWEWYLAFKRDDGWKTIRHRNISREDTNLYIQAG